MITELLELIRTWPVLGQFFFIITLATLATFVALAVIGAVGDFLNYGLANIIHGHPEHNNEETPKEDR